MTVRGRWRAVVACALVAAATVAEPAAPPDLDFRPAPRSALQSQTEPAFVVARQDLGDRVVTLLARRRTGDRPLPVMRLEQQGQGSEARVAIQHVAPASDDELATLEQLYVLLMRQDPLARYDFGEGLSRCGSDDTALSHARALQVLAACRERAAAGVTTAVPWRVVEMRGVVRHPDDPDVVGVSALGPDGPLRRATLYFNRAPHSICAARTGEDGQARCRLEDQHGDGDQHSHATAVVVTYPGELHPDRVLLPTTYVLPLPPTLPAFARPPALPFAWPAGENRR